MTSSTTSHRDSVAAQAASHPNASSPADARADDGDRARADASRRSRQRGRTVRAWLRRVALALLVVALIGLVAVALVPAPVPVDLARASRGAMVVAVTEDGRTRVKNRFVVAAPLTGNMPRLSLWEGDEVTEGALLASIVPAAAPLLDARSRAQAQARLDAALAGQRQAAAQTRRARVALQEAEATANRQRGLEASGVASKEERERAEFAQRGREQEVKAAEFAARVAAEEVESARAALGVVRDKGNRQEHFDLRAPVAGLVLRVVRRDAGPVAAGTPLLELGDPSSLEVVVDVLTRDAVKLSVGTPASIVRWGGDAELAGHVRRIEPSAFTRVSALGVEEQRVNVLIDFDGPPAEWKRLGDGFRVEARLDLWRAADVVTVPASAVFRHGDDWAVFALRDGRATLTTIEAGQRSDTQVEILAGLAEGERVVLYPSDRVDDGVRIEGR